MRIIDVSKYQGKIDWRAVSEVEDLAGVIFRTTTQSGKLDEGLIENYKNAKMNFNAHFNTIEGYKFTYATNYAEARIECFNTISKLDEAGIEIDRLWLDLEKQGTHEMTSKECDEVILAYCDQCSLMNMPLGLYFNRNYALNIVNDRWRHLPLWIARYNRELGDIGNWKAKYWQYTDCGQIDGIPKDVDISKVL